jgi:N-acetylglucosaminyldiphosphoundecaprenol N-acetyl-beta-D-mannosaminyltransferase
MIQYYVKKIGTVFTVIFLAPIRLATGITRRGLVSYEDAITLFSIPIQNATMDDAVQFITGKTAATATKHICFVNSDCVNITTTDKEYLSILQQADAVYADGIGMKIAGIILKKPIRQNVNGTDLFPPLCKTLEEENKRIFLLGGQPGIADRVREYIHTHYPRLSVAGVQHGFFNDDDEKEILRRIAVEKPDVLLVALGVPLQEKWIFTHQASLGAGVAIGVGGLFDFYSGRIPRAPYWMRKIGLEWLFRFYQEPRRLWKRYFIGNIVFLLRTVSK